jgi:hypothetical protein
MSIEDLTGSAAPASTPAADRATAAYALIAATAGDAPAEAGGRLEHAVKDVFALYGVDADGWTDKLPDPGRERPRPQAA